MFNCFRQRKLTVTGPPTPDSTVPKRTRVSKYNYWQRWRADRCNKKEWEAYHQRIANEETIAAFLAKEAEPEAEARAVELTFCEQFTAEPGQYVREGAEEGTLRGMGMGSSL